MSFTRKIKGIINDLDSFVSKSDEKSDMNKLQSHERERLSNDLKKAKLLLHSKDEDTVLEGIHLLNDVAAKAAKNANTESYVGKVHNTLCGFLRKRYAVNDSEDYLLSTNNDRIIKDTLINILFRNENNLYGEYKADLSNVNLSNCDLSKIDLTEAKLTESDLSFALLNGTNLEGANLSYTNLSGTKIADANFKFAKLIFTELAASHISNSDFSNTDLSYANLSMTLLDGVDFGESCFANARMTGAALSRVRFDGADMSYAKLGSLDFIGATANKEKKYLYQDMDQHPDYAGKTKLLNEIIKPATLGNVAHSGSNLSGSFSFE